MVSNFVILFQNYFGFSGVLGIFIEILGSLGPFPAKKPGILLNHYSDNVESSNPET